jgi:predicted Zn-dependent protease
MVPGRLSGALPREKIHLEPMIFDARERMMGGDVAGALGTARAVLHEDPANRYALQLATTAAARTGRFDEAVQLAEETLHRYPEYAPAWIARGDLYVRDGRFREAADTFRAGLDKSPREPALAYRLALALLSDGRTSEASAVAEKAIAAKEEQPSFLVVRALCRARSGDSAAAREALAEAIAKGYRNREALEHEPLLAPLRAVPGFRDELKAIPHETKA